MSKHNKANVAEKETRINTIYDMLMRGSNRAAILQYVSTETDWNITPRQVDNYIKEANAQLAAEAEFHKAGELGKAIARMNAVIMMSFKAGDTARVVQAQHQINQLVGNYQAVKTELKLTADNEILLTRLFGELESQGMDASDLFNSLLAKLAAQKVTEGNG